MLWENVEVGVSKTGLAIRFNQLSYKCKLNVYSMVFDHDNLSGTDILRLGVSGPSIYIFPRCWLQSKSSFSTNFMNYYDCFALKLNSMYIIGDY